MITGGGFGYTLDLTTGTLRRWYIDRNGVKRWVHNKEEVK